MPEISHLKEEDQSVLAHAYSLVWKAEAGVQGQPELHRGILSKEKGKAEGRVKRGGGGRRRILFTTGIAGKGEQHLSPAAAPSFPSPSPIWLSLSLSLSSLISVLSLTVFWIFFFLLLSVETTQRVYLGSRFPADQSASRISSS